MKKIRVQDAVGETICHDMTGIGEHGEKRVFFRRGHVVSPEDVPVLLGIGKSHIYVWEPDAGEVHEDDAATALAVAICGENLTLDETPSEGKVQLYAGVDGLFCVDRDGLKKINSVGDYTVACLPNLTRVSKGQKVCGLRIIPLVTKQNTVDLALKIASEHSPIMSVKPFLPLRCALVITGTEVYEGRRPDKFEPILKDKLAGYGGVVIGAAKCPDDTDKILSAILDFRRAGADLILLTGGMSVDPDDLTPEAIRRSGAEVISHGVPMQPGNMLMLAYLGDAALVGVPAASLTSPATSLDVFLPRIFAGQRIAREEIAAYGEGGLCLGCGKCRFPVCYFGRGH